MEGRKPARSHPPQDFQLGRWLVQPARNVLRHAGTLRRLEPQLMDLLTFLAASGGRVVSKDEIIDGVWEGRFIAEATLTRSIADLRRALDDNQRAPRYIETIPKRGYRLVAAVSNPGPRPAESSDRTIERGSVVLPFAKSPDSNRAEPSPAGARVADRLAAARRKRFVGREREIGLFRAALAADEASFVVVHIVGSGGVGKTTLLHEFARIAAEAGRPVVHVDGRNIEPSPAAVLLALGPSRSSESDPAAAIREWPAGGVLLIDTYELLAPLDDWLRATLLPQLPAHTVVVCAGRNEPAAAWRTDSAWAPLTRIQTLGNLNPEESRAYLTRCGVGAEAHDEALTFTRGHPLALSLIADVLTRGARVSASRLDSDPEVVRLLLETFVRNVPSRDHRLALYTCVSAWATTEPLLAAVLNRDDVHDVFEWLSRLPFVEHGPYGLFPHDLARDIVAADFQRRDPDAAFRVTECILAYFFQRLGRTGGLERQRVWFDLLYMQRYNAAMRPYFEWAGFGSAYAETAGSLDHDAIIAMITRHEGDASAVIARYWLTRQPEAFQSIRSVAGELIGFVTTLWLDAVGPEDVAADPAVAAAMTYVERHGPLRSGEHIRYGRYWMGADRYQALTQVFTVVAASSSQTWLAPTIAWSFVTMADPDLVEPMFTEIRMWRVRDADFEVGGRHYGVFGHDWRVEPAHEWLRLKAERACRMRSHDHR